MGIAEGGVPVTWEFLGKVLVREGRITEEAWAETIATAVRTGKDIFALLAARSLGPENELMLLLAGELKVPYIDLSNYLVDPAIARLVPREFSIRHRLLAINKVGNRLTVAMVDPADFVVIDDLQLMTGLAVRPVITFPRDIQAQFQEVFGEEAAYGLSPDSSEVEDAAAGEAGDPVASPDGGTPDDEAVVRTCNLILSRVQAGSTEFHVEPCGDQVRVRHRLDGVLDTMMEVPLGGAEHLVARFKRMAAMNLQETRTPQEGVIRMKIDGKPFQFWVSSLPVVHRKGRGEKLKITLLVEGAAGMRRLPDLGLEPGQLAHFSRALQARSGVIVASGRLLSGKSTTLYACLAELNSVQRQCASAEYWITNFLDGVNQVHCQYDKGFRLEDTLRTLIRQQAECVLLGDMMDFDTTELAFRAGMTGHLILAPLFCDEAASVFPRIGNMGIDRYHLAEALLLISNQRRVRKLCPECRVETRVSSEQVSHFQITSDLLRQAGINSGSTYGLSAFEGKGCERCQGTGYQGTEGVFEVIPTSSPLKKAIMEDCPKERFRELMAKEGHPTLREVAVKKVLLGLTSFTELIRLEIDHL